MSWVNVQDTPPGACGAVAGYCLCTLSRHGHETPHQCLVPGCGGMWWGNWFDHTFRAVRFPEMGVANR